MIVRKIISRLLPGAILFVPTILGAANLFDFIRESTDWEILKGATEQLTVEDIRSTNANINSRNHNGETVLMLATIYNKNPAIIQAILDKGATLQTSHVDVVRPCSPAVISSIYEPCLHSCSARSQMNLKPGFLG